VVHVGDIGMLSASDDAILAHAATSGQVIISADTDFGVLLAVSGASRPSVVLLRSSDSGSAGHTASRQPASGCRRARGGSRRLDRTRPTPRTPATRTPRLTRASRVANAARGKEPTQEPTAANLKPIQTTPSQELAGHGRSGDSQRRIWLPWHGRGHCFDRLPRDRMGAGNDGARVNWGLPGSRGHPALPTPSLRCRVLITRLALTWLSLVIHRSESGRWTYWITRRPGPGRADA
jgi:hypothetical protein